MWSKILRSTFLTASVATKWGRQQELTDASSQIAAPQPQTGQVRPCLMGRPFFSLSTFPERFSVLEADVLQRGKKRRAEPPPETPTSAPPGSEWPASSEV